MKGLGIGRVVHYVAYGTPGGEFPVGAHRAAIVTEVDAVPDGSPDEGRIGVCVMNPTGLFYNQHLPFDATASKPGTWHWPEFVE